MGHSSPEVHAFFPKTLTVRRALESAWADAPLSKPKLNAEADRRVNAILRWFQRELHPNSDPSTLTPLETIAQACIPRICPETKRLAKAKHTREAEAQRIYDDFMHDDTDLVWAEEVTFRDLTFASQRLLLFLRATVAQPDLVILDEALSGVDERVRDKALLFLSHGEKVAEVVDGTARMSALEQLGKVCVEGLSEQQALLVISHSKEDVPGCLREYIRLPDEKGQLPTVGTLPGPLELHSEAWKGMIWR
jgi:ABC-type molybdenum transport system ATPase subunit/photorepair protein PhrA